MSIVWADRAPVGWIDELEEICICRGLRAAVSPIHDKDYWTDRDESQNPDHVSGTAKPAHYHVLITCPDGSVTENTMKQLLSPITDAVKKVTLTEGGLGAQYEYLTHKNSPSKAPYDEKNIVLLNGFDPLSIKTPRTKAERLLIRKTIRELIKSQGIISMIDLEETLEREGMFQELAYIEESPYKAKVLLDDNAKRIEYIKDSIFLNEYVQPRDFIDETDEDNNITGRIEYHEPETNSK